MAIDIVTADTYFTTEVLHNQAWTGSDNGTKTRALKNAENTLYRVFKKYNPTDKPLPEKAVFEQAIFLLQKDETILKQEQGVTNVSVQGISITMKGTTTPISPETYRIIMADGGLRVGRYK